MVKRNYKKLNRALIITAIILILFMGALSTGIIGGTKSSMLNNQPLIDVEFESESQIFSTAMGGVSPIKAGP